MKRSTALWIALGCGLLLCLLAALAAVTLLLVSDPLGLLAGRGQQVLLALPTRHGHELVLVRAGQPLESGLVLAQDVDPGGFDLRLWREGRDAVLGGPEFGGFVPGIRHLYIQSEAGGETVLYHHRLGRQGPLQVFSSEATGVQALVLEGGDTLLIREPRGGPLRCYLSQAGAPALRVARGDQCLIARDGSTLLAAETGAQGLTVTVSRADGSEPLRLLDTTPAADVLLADDGSRVAYVEGLPSGQAAVVLRERSDGSLLAEGEPVFSVLALEMAGAPPDLFYIGETEDGDLALHTLGSRSEHLASAARLDAAWSADGAHLIYLVGEPTGVAAVQAWPAQGGAARELARGELLGFTLLGEPEHVLIAAREDDELVILAAPVDGGAALELFRRAGFELAGPIVDRGSRLELALRDAQGQRALFSTSLGVADGALLLERWIEVDVIGRSGDGRWLALAGRELPGDDVTLYAVETRGGQPPRLLDDDFEVLVNAVFTPDDRQLLYTVRIGPDPDDVEVRRAALDGSARPQALYPGAMLVDAAWSPFAAAVDPRPLLAGREPTGHCPGAHPLALGQTVEGSITPGSQDCYRLRLSEPGEVTFSVRSAANADTFLELYTRQGRLLAEDDDSGPGVNPRLRWTFVDPGVYYVVVRGYSTSSAGEYSLTALAGRESDPFTQARPLSLGEPVRGTIGPEDELYLEQYDALVYGAMYSFPAQAGEWIEARLQYSGAASPDSTGMVLFDPQRELLIASSADDTGAFQLESPIESSGHHFLLLVYGGEGRAPSRPASFTLTAARVPPPEPGGGPIALGQTVEGRLRGRTQDLWVFEGQAGDIVTIRMISAEFDSYLELRGPGGQSLITDDDGLGYPDAAIQNFRLPARGAYTIVARSYGDHGFGRYALSLAAGEDVPTGGGAIATGQTVAGELLSSEGDLWTFSGTAGARVTIAVDSPIDTTLTLYGPDGTELRYNDDGGPGLNPLIEDYLLPATGEYTIRVRGFGGRTGSYQLSLQ